MKSSVSSCNDNWSNSAMFEDYFAGSHTYMLIGTEFFCLWYSDNHLRKTDNN